MLHLWLYKIAENSIFSFGTFYVLHITGSIGWALAWGLMHGVVLFSLRLSGGSFLLPLLRLFGPARTALIGIAGEALAALTLLHTNQGGLVLLGAGAISAAGSAVYIAVLHSGLFKVMGDSQRPGLAVALTDLLRIAAVLIVAALGTAIGKSSPQLLYIIPALAFVGAGISLLLVRFPKTDIAADYRPAAFLRVLSAGCLWANWNPEFQFIRRAVPIILVTALGEQKTLPWLAWLPLLEAMVSILIGHMHDIRQHLLVRATALGWVATWVVASAVPPDILPYMVAVMSVLSAGISTTRDAKTALEVAASDNPLAAAMAFETARGFGSMCGTSVIVGSWLLTGNVPSALLSLGALTACGKIAYVWNSPEQPSVTTNGT